MGELNTVEDKLSWIFTAFDADGGGSIDSEEIYDICEGLFRLAGIEDDPDLLASCVSDVRYARCPVPATVSALSNVQLQISFINHLAYVFTNLDSTRGKNCLFIVIFPR